MLDDVFYAPPRDIHGDRIVLDDDERRHLITVTRHDVGDTITVVDGLGTAYACVIQEIDKKNVVCAVRSHATTALHPRIVLGFGLLRNPSRIDSLVEKATELGVSRFVPVLTERVLHHRIKADRWEKIALAAMKQSGRSHLPTIASLTPLNEFFNATPASALAIIPHEKGSYPPLTQVRATQDFDEIAICVGPEGGFTDEEIDLAVKHGYQPVSLGEYRLRAETAAIAAVANCSLGRLRVGRRE